MNRKSNSCSDKAYVLLEENHLETALNLKGARPEVLSSDVICLGVRGQDYYVLTSFVVEVRGLSNQTLSPSFLELKDVPALKLRVHALTSRVCSHSYGLVIDVRLL
ncbi:hypothetical protein Tco_1476229 [Tanacetum coccineum]